MIPRRRGTPGAPQLPGSGAKPALLRRSGQLLRRLGPSKAVLLITALAVAGSFALMLASNMVMAPPDQFVTISLALSVAIPMLVAPPVAWLVVRLMFDADDARRTAERLAVLDPLTLAFNRRHFFDVGERALARADEAGAELSVLLIDIDHFKRVNDEHGHATGDRVLTRVARVCSEHLREHELFARFGGEEFAVLLPDTSLDEARRVAERLRLAVQALVTPTAGPATIGVTLSIGAALAVRGASLDSVLASADEAMYAAKRAGRDRVMSAA